MTGTSLDGIDVALVRIDGRGMDLRTTLLASHHAPLLDARRLLLPLAGGEPRPAVDFLQAARRLGEVHAEAIGALLAKSDPQRDIDFVVAHGQTVWHAPGDLAGPLSMQLMDPWPIVRRLGVPVCYDLRQADLVAGGQGAPITPLSDWLLLRGRANFVVNLGGICNVTAWPADSAAPKDIRGSDIGPCNLLLDSVVAALFPGEHFDRDGALSAGGTPDRRLVQQISDAIGQRLQDSRSLGREIFGAPWIRSVLQLSAGCSPAVTLASAIAAVARRVAESARQHQAQHVVLAGGGARNPTLVSAITRHSSLEVSLIDELGIPAECREAVAMAVLGALCADGVPITLPQVTGAADPGIAGVWAGGHGR